MGFATPAFLLLALLGGLVLALHSRQMRRRVVGSLRLWRELALPSAQRRARRRWPPLSFPLVLQLGAVILLAIALAQPFWSDDRPPQHLIVVLDASEGMAVRGSDGATRLEMARAMVKDELGGAGVVGPERVSLVVAGTRPQVAAARWPWQPDILSGPLARVDQENGPVDWRAAQRLIEGLTRDDEGTRFAFVSHRSPPTKLVEAVGGDDRLASMRVGDARPHASVSAQATEIDVEAGEWRLHGTVAFKEGLEETELRIGYSAEPDASAITWATLDLEADDDGRAEFSEDLELPGPGLLTLRFIETAGPDIATRFLLPQARGEMDVLYIGPGAQPFLRALSARDGVNVYEADNLPDDISEFGLVIVDRTTVSRAPESNTLWIGDARVEAEAEPEPLDNPDPDDWSALHPLSEGIDWSELVVDAAFRMPPLPGADRLLSAQGAPLISAATTAHGRSVRLAFDPADSNWPEQSGFALFSHALLDWSGQQPGTLPVRACTVGAPCQLDARLGAATLEPFAGTDASADRLRGGSFVPRTAGLFRAASEDGRETFVAVNPAPSLELRTAPEPTDTSGDMLEDDEDAAAARQAGDAEGSNQEVVAQEETSETATSASLLPRGWAVWLLALGAGLWAADALLATRRHTGRIPRVAPIALAGVVAALLAVFNAPVPQPQPREVIVSVRAPDQSQNPENATDAGKAELPSGNRLTGPQVAEVVAGDTPRLVRDPGEGGLHDATAMRVPQAEAAMQLAAAAIPEGRKGRLVLAGESTSPIEDAVSLERRDRILERLQGAPPPDGEITVRSIWAPRQLLAGDTIPVIGFIHAQEATTAELSIYLDGEVIAEETVDLSAGQNRIESTIPELEAGDTLIEMAVAAEGDTYERNNRTGRILSARATRPIAVVSPSAAQGDAFAGFLEDSGLDVEVMTPARAPHYTRGWLQYGGVVLLNTPALELTSRQQGLLEDAVSRHGLGLLILGGENSFGPGGYLETPLDRVSPLSSRIPRDAPEIGMVFVLDRSGSMQQPVGDLGNRLDVAKNATISAFELLNPQSQVGLVVFDSESREIMPIQTLDMEIVRSALAGVDPGGGTAIYPGLVEAWQMIRDIDAPARHVVVMTDGLSQPGDYPGILGEMRAGGVTASGVAIGEGADRSTVETIAELGGGSAHVTTDFEALPAILSQEAMLLSEPVEEIRTQPQWEDTAATFLRGLPDPMPPLEGFVLTTAKPDARVAMTAPDSEGDDAPIMAWWRYGNGRVLAFTSDATGPWTRHWQQLEQYAGLWPNVLLEFQPGTYAPGDHLEVSGDGETLRATVTSLNRDGEFRSGLALAAEVDTPAEEALQFPLHETRPGVYQGQVPLYRPGTYSVRITVPYDTEVPVPTGEDAELIARYHHGYPVEYDFGRTARSGPGLGADTDGAGRDPEAIIAAAGGLTVDWRDGWRYWALLALALFMVELFRRYAAPAPRRNRLRTPEGRSE